MLLLLYYLNHLAAMAYQFPCAEAIYCNLILNQMYLKYCAKKNSYIGPI